MKLSKIVVSACVVAAFLLSGCSGASTQLDAGQPENQLLGEHAAPEVTAADSGPAAPKFDYGPIAGTVRVNMQSTEGYTGTMDVVIHHPVLKNSLAEVPSWCVNNFDNSSRDNVLDDASTILYQAIETTVKLGELDGVPAPQEWGPTAETGLYHIANIPSSGECYTNSTGSEEPVLTEEGYQTVYMDVVYGRSTPTERLPQTIDQVDFRAPSLGFSVDAGYGGTCSVEPTDDFNFDTEKGNSPSLNDGGCSFKITLK